MSQCPYKKIKESFTPPFPKPHKNKLARAGRFFAGFNSWIHTLYEKSFTMKMGEVRLPRFRIFIPNEESLVNHIMLDREGKFPKHHSQHELLCPLLGESIFTTNGEKWQRQREMINPAFAHTNLKKVFGMMQSVAFELVEQLKAQPNNTLIDPLMTHITADIIFRTILSRQLNFTDAASIHTAFNKYQQLAQRAAMLRLYRLPEFFLNNSLKKQAATIHSVFGGITRDRYADFHQKVHNGTELPNEDILDSLMAAKDPQTGKYFTFAEIVDQLSIIFLAGHETSASALTWSLYLVAQCPEYQREVFEEISPLMQNGQLQFEDVRSLEKTANLFNEALRLYPPVSFLPREAVEETEMRGKPIRKGDMISISPWLTQRNGIYWQEPHSFNPQRFDAENTSEQEAIKKMFMPFGKGKRICIGAGFAKQEAILVLAHIIYNFKILPVKSHKVEPVSRLTTRPKNGVRLSFFGR